MNTLAEEGLVLFAGPLAGSEQSRIRVLPIAGAPDQEQIHQRLSGDPWEITRRVVTTSIEPWSPLAGAQRLAATALPQREAEARSSPQIGPLTWATSAAPPGARGLPAEVFLPGTAGVGLLPRTGAATEPD